MIALSSRNSLLTVNNLNKLGLITKELIKLKKIIRNDKKNLKKIINKFKKSLIKKYKIKIEYLECRNTINLSTNIKTIPFKLFVAYYLNKVRLIDNF